MRKAARNAVDAAEWLLVLQRRRHNKALESPCLQRKPGSFSKRRTVSEKVPNRITGDKCLCKRRGSKS
jgi:hypothetical protein